MQIQTMKKTLIPALTLIMIWSCNSPSQNQSEQQGETAQETTSKTYDILVDTDLGGDPDDIQSLYRLIHYSDILKVKGIVSTPCTNLGGHPWDTLPHVPLIQEWIQRVDVDQLRENGYTDLMPESELLSLVKKGRQDTGTPSPETSTEGSDWIIQQAKNYSPEDPLWVLVWGSITTVAQALHDAPEIAPNLRLYSIASTNTMHDTASREYVYQFMQDDYPEMWWIENGLLPRGSRGTFRGVYQSGDQSGEWAFTEFIPANIRGHGSDHDGLFAEKCGDAFPTANWPKNSLKEGDSPTMLYLVSPVLGGVGDVDDPTQESWGGQFYRPYPEQFPNYYTDLDTTAEACQATIGKWRRTFLEDWKKRWDRYDEVAP